MDVCFDLVVSDMIMPDMCGAELVERISDICPNIAVVMMSGSVRGENLPTGAKLISKPFLLKTYTQSWTAPSPTNQ